MSSLRGKGDKSVLRFPLAPGLSQFSPFLYPCPSEESDVSKADLSIGKTLSLLPSDILRNAPAFLLSKARHNTYEEFPFTANFDTI